MTTGTREESPLREPSIPGYAIEGYLGGGGMGVVWKARRQATNEAVAVKLIRGAVAPGSNEMARFRLEAELLEQVQDPNVVQLFHAGEVDRVPYLVMEYVGGGTLDRRMKSVGRFDPREAARLMQTLASAMGRVHHRGILHRDLKPANVLTTAEGVLKIGDFGLARSLGREGKSLTNDAEILGTPEYISPEQARGKNPLYKVGASTDVYSLGVILYQMLTGQLPLSGDSALKTLILVGSKAEPRPPRSVRKAIPRDLEAICMKCLAKHPGRRYQDGAALAGDLGRFLESRPVTARHVGGAERALRLGLRHPLVTALVAATGAVMALAVVNRFEAEGRRLAEATAQLEVARTETAQAQQAEEKARADAKDREARDAAKLAGVRRQQSEDNAYFGGIIAADREAAAGHLSRASAMLADCPANLRGWEWNQLYRRLNSERLRARFTQNRGGSSPLDSPQDRVLEQRGNPSWRTPFPLAFSPDGRRLTVAPGLTAGLEGLTAGRPRRLEFGRFEDVFTPEAFSPDGELAAAFFDGKHEIAVWKFQKYLFAALNHHEKFRTLAGHRGDVVASAFSPDGRRLVSASKDGSIRVWEIATGTEGPRFDLPAGFAVEGGSVAFAPGGKSVAALVWRQGVREGEREEVRELWVWDLDRPRPRLADGVVEHLPDKGHAIDTRGAPLVFSPDGRLLAFEGTDGSIRVVDAATGMPRRLLPGHPGSRSRLCLAFFPDGGRLASGGRDRTVRVWDLASGDRPPVVLPAHDNAVTALAVSPDGRLLATADKLEVKVWDLESLQGLIALGGRAESVAFHPGGAVLAVGGDDRVVRLHDPKTGKVVGTLGRPADEPPPQVPFPLGVPKPDGRVRAVAFSPDGKTLAVGTARGVDIWDFERKTYAWTADQDGSVNAIVFSPDGGVFIASSDGGPLFTHKLRAWSLRTRRGVDLMPKSSLMFGLSSLVVHPGRPELFVIGPGLRLSGQADVMDYETGRNLRTIEGVSALAFDPEGRWAARATMLDRARGRLDLIDVREDKVASSIPFPQRIVLNLAFNRDGSRLAAAGTINDSEQPATLEIWDPRGRRQMLTLTGFGGWARQALFSPDGNLLVALGGDGVVRIWDGTPPAAGEVP